MLSDEQARQFIKYCREQSDDPFENSDFENSVLECLNRFNALVKQALAADRASRPSEGWNDDMTTIPQDGMALEVIVPCVWDVRLGGKDGGLRPSHFPFGTAWRVEQDASHEQS